MGQSHPLFWLGHLEDTPQWWQSFQNIMPLSFSPPLLSLFPEYSSPGACGVPVLSMKPLFLNQMSFAQRRATEKA
jgi:hypothetical protein